ncbi:hypothetical protein [Geomesophilobacter sediminis]|uniref:Uncharacterized protein n=1 Tax=Geomesophilobacter sediminis TaxID=2798584 RepID=A0A8J7JE67_9BACT|nr:hypothetical protein [Geomesophilobacter sediminis]MBJ6724224.1 hypothetical protein [Geomesophilobacter sediminis]
MEKRRYVAGERQQGKVPGEGLHHGSGIHFNRTEDVQVNCPKCKAKLGMMKDRIVVGTGAVHCIRCYICGYWVQSEPS